MSAAYPLERAIGRCVKVGPLLVAPRRVELHKPWTVIDQRGESLFHCESFRAAVRVARRYLWRIEK